MRVTESTGSSSLLTLRRIWSQADRKFITDVAWNVASLGAVGIAGLVLTIVVARYYGPNALGVFGQVFAFLTIAAQAAVGGFVFGILHYLPRLTEEPSERAAVFASALYPTMALAAAVATAVWLLSGTLGDLLGSRATGLGLQLISPAIFLFAVNKCLLFSLNALRSMRLFALGQMLRMLFYLAGALALIAGGADSVLLPLCFPIGELLLTVFLIGATRRHLTWSVRAIDPSWVLRLTRYGRDGFFIGLLVDINLKVDVIVLGFFLSDAKVGLYVFMAVFADGFAQLPVILQNNLNPLLSRTLHQQPRGSVRPYLLGLHLYLVPAMMLIAIGATLLLPELADRLTGDPSFGAAWPIFAVLAAGIALTSGFSPLFFSLNQAGRPDLQSALYMTGLVVNIIGNLVLISAFGVIGAAIATSLALILMVPTLAVLYRRATGQWIWS